MLVMRLLCAVAVLATCIDTADASYLSSQDWKTAGDGLLTHDSYTGSLWLDLSATKGRSYADVVANLAPGGDFSGFRVASSSEVLQLLYDADLPSSFGYTQLTSTLESAYQAFSSLVTPTFVATANPSIIVHYSYSHAFYSDSSTGPPTPRGYAAALSIFMIDYTSPSQSDRVGIVRWRLFDQTPDNAVATWLIKNNDAVTTPEPTSIALAGFAGVGMAIGAWRRRRQQPATTLSQTAA